MMNDLWNTLKRFIGMDASWEMMTLSRVGIDPVTARALTQVLQPVHTVRLRPEPAQEADEAGQLQIIWHGITDTGMVRPQNEDALGLHELGRDALLVVADGMGGHDAGATASRIAVETAAKEAAAGRLKRRDPLAGVAQAVRAANAAVTSEALRRVSNMGTTLTAALVVDGTAYIASVGDSRAYWIANGSITQITRDHSLVARLVEAGRLTKEEARTDPRSNLLFRTIGNGETVEVDTFRVPLERGGILLLCTDGLWGELGDDDLLRICAEEQHTEVICARLVQQANANGGKDNISAIVMKVL